MIARTDLTTAQWRWLVDHGHINGCGPTSWKRTIPTPHASSVCEDHDLRYWVGGTASDRAGADYALYDGIRRAVRREWIGQLVIGHVDAFCFYLAVRWKGRKHWNARGPRPVPAAETAVA